MKSILYAGVTLMIGASIYGFVDYRKTSHSKEFKTMYNSKEEPVVVATPGKAITKEAIPVENNLPAAEKTIMHKETTTPLEEIKMKKDTIENNTKPAAKRLNYRFFSRAPLERKYIDKETKTNRQ